MSFSLKGVTTQCSGRTTTKITKARKEISAKVSAFLCLVLFCWFTPVEAMTIADLFAALREHPLTELDVLQTRSAELGVQSIYDRLYPSLTGIVAYDEYNSPTNLRPVPPTEAAQLLENNKPLPFSDSIGRMGARLSMPIFVKELFSLGNQAASLADSYRIKKRLNLLEHQAVLVTTDAHLLYMASLRKALESRKNSLEKTRQDITLQVTTGRLPETEQIRMDEAINQIDLTFNQTWQQQSDLQKNIESLTGIVLEEPVTLQLNGSLNKGELFALKPLQKNVEAREFSVQAARDRLYPSIIGTANWFHNYGEGYNTGTDVDVEYGGYSLSLQMPLFNKPAYTAIEQANIELRREKTRFTRTKIDLEAKARNLTRNLELLNESKKFAQDSVANQRELLNVAKVAYASKRMSQEEYLRYEEKILAAEANYYLTEARWWETFATLAVLYGNNLDELIQ
ncbi:outer membrane protein [Desulfocapsa sulfexigens DSM 10523]|uniref:Outer membrane protein n=1 Tax=Desulfocapsa sulfexigens (strain DSM 10523 / SB164P1) TaxID=1167006 RepID=M1PDE0_DESSD|nr:TolC family protein [Desulfocapsa sulfexigens]AGF77760.1 outer membrane protein [Desulfocapsa sulfexigens DSM 10523]